MKIIRPRIALNFFIFSSEENDYFVFIIFNGFKSVCPIKGNVCLMALRFLWSFYLLFIQVKEKKEKNLIILIGFST
ncbi:MAG: hypothetical protein CL678_12185 [Bdellovibrionaceae bacterium]|nr:hypothetical protein [Pseudobdellovibrionaceae bacterium]